MHYTLRDVYTDVTQHGRAERTRVVALRFDGRDTAWWYDVGARAVLTCRVGFLARLTRALSSVDRKEMPRDACLLRTARRHGEHGSARRVQRSVVEGETWRILRQGNPGMA